MGKGYHYICKQCGNRYAVHIGAGMGYPTEYGEIISDLARGKYGAELQEVFLSTPYAAVDGGKAVFVCPGCGSWERGTDLTLYAPNEPLRIPNKRYGRKTVAEWGYVPFVTRGDLEEDYHVLKRHYHHCGKCGKRMHKASSDELRNLPCPKCGSPNQAESGFFWD